MEPLSILALVETCAGLAVTAGKLSIGLRNLASTYKYAAVTFRSISSQCKLFATAVRAIQAWMEDVPTDSLTNIDDQIWEQLADSLDCANEAILALECELVDASKGTVNTFWQKVNIVWNLQILQHFQDCIHKQVTGLGVILQIINLPDRQEQIRKLAEQSNTFDDSRSSVVCFRQADCSTLRNGDGSSTFQAPSTFLTSVSQATKFDFDDMLLTSQVYLRNRNKTLALHEAQGTDNRDIRGRDCAHPLGLQLQVDNTLTDVTRNLKKKPSEMVIRRTSKYYPVQERQIHATPVSKWNRDGVGLNTSQVLADLQVSLTQMKELGATEIAKLIGLRQELQAVIAVLSKDYEKSITEQQLLRMVCDYCRMSVFYPIRVGGLQNLAHQQEALFAVMATMRPLEANLIWREYQ